MSHDRQAPQWEGVAGTNDVVPLGIKDNTGEPVVGYLCAVVPYVYGAATPAAGVFAAVETDGTMIGPRISGLPAGYYRCFPKIGGTILDAVIICLV